LADFQAHLEELREKDVSVLALSTDPPEKARETVEQEHLGFPVVCGLKLPDDADRIGAFSDVKRHIIEPANFLLGPDRRILLASYAAGPLGRMRAEDIMQVVGFYEARREAKGGG